MRIVIAAVLCAVLAGCGPSSGSEASASAPEPLTGVFRAESDSARTLTGNLSLERGGLIFDKGVVLYTRSLLPRQASERVSRDGDSYAAILVSPADIPLELRRVTEQTLANGAVGLCGDEEPGYVAIARQDRAAGLVILVFAGDEPPGPEAAATRLCGAFAYTAPEGARTRIGVVLR